MKFRARRDIKKWNIKATLVQLKMYNGVLFVCEREEYIKTRSLLPFGFFSRWNIFCKQYRSRCCCFLTLNGKQARSLPRKERKKQLENIVYQFGSTSSAFRNIEVSKKLNDFSRCASYIFVSHHQILLPIFVSAICSRNISLVNDVCNFTFETLNTLGPLLLSMEITEMLKRTST